MIQGNEEYALVDAHFLLGPLLVTHFIVTSQERRIERIAAWGRGSVFVFLIDETRVCLLIVGGKEASVEGDTVHCLITSIAPGHLPTQF